MQQSIGDIETLIREEQRMTSVESHSEAWADGLSAGIEPEIIAEAALTTACAELARTSGEHVALALVELIREKLACGEFDTARTRH